jgi:hypothetical protein
MIISMGLNNGQIMRAALAAELTGEPGAALRNVDYGKVGSFGRHFSNIRGINNLDSHWLPAGLEVTMCFVITEDFLRRVGGKEEEFIFRALLKYVTPTKPATPKKSVKTATSRFRKS